MNKFAMLYGNYLKNQGKYFFFLLTLSIFGLFSFHSLVCSLVFTGVISAVQQPLSAVVRHIALDDNFQAIDIHHWRTALEKKKKDLKLIA